MLQTTGVESTNSVTIVTLKLIISEKSLVRMRHCLLTYCNYLGLMQVLKNAHYYTKCTCYMTAIFG